MMILVLEIIVVLDNVNVLDAPMNACLFLGMYPPYPPLPLKSFTATLFQID